VGTFLRHSVVAESSPSDGYDTFVAPVISRMSTSHHWSSLLFLYDTYE